MQKLHWADYLVCITFLLVSFAIGLYHAVSGGRQRTVAEFIMANRNLKVIPTMMSMTLSIISAIMVLGLSSEIYSYGITICVWSTVGIAIGILIVQQLFIVWLFPMQLTSSFEYLERRFQSRAVRAVASFLGVTSGILLTGVSIYAPSLALEAVAGVPADISVSVVSSVVTFYTALGGMKAVVWTDVFQGCVMLVGLVAILIRSWILVPPRTAYQVALDSGRLTWLEISLDPHVRHTTWSLMAGMCFTYLHLFGVSQSAVQRYSAISSLPRARMTALLAIPFIVILISVTTIVSANVFSYFALWRCDPVTSGSITKNTHVLPYFVQITFEEFRGFTGLLLAILYSGALSTASSNLSGCAANIWEDWVKGLLGNKLTEFQATLVNKVIVVIVGAFGLGISLLCTVMPGTLIAITASFFAVCGGPLVGIFLLGGITRKSTWQGAVVGAMASFSFLVWLIIGAQISKIQSIDPKLPQVPTDGCQSNISKPEWTAWNSTLIETGNEQPYERTGIRSLYRLSYLWYQPIAVSMVFVIGMGVSYVVRYCDPNVKKIHIDDECLIPWDKVFSLKWNPYQHSEPFKGQKQKDGDEETAEALMAKESLT